MSSTHSWLVALGAALVFAVPASAQQAASASASVVPAVSAVQVTAPAPAFSLAPTRASAALSLRVTPDAAPAAPAAAMVPMPAGGQSENVALMIVGGAALVVGSVIHGDTGTIVMVSGGVIGLIGLYRYLR